MATENNGGKTSYYDVPKNPETLNDLIEFKNMPFWRGEAFKALYALEERAERGGNASIERELNKVIYYAKRGLKLLKENKSDINIVMKITIEDVLTVTTKPNNNPFVAEHFKK